MHDQDNTCQFLGIKLDTIAPGYARLHMRVTTSMLNFHNTCHGGFIFTLADSAFAYACNSHSQNTVGVHAAIDFLAPAWPDDELTAVAEERKLGKRNGVYDITVRDQNGRLIALFRGLSQRIQDASEE